jgi:hypothetical protein
VHKIVYLSLGSNVGDRAANLNAAIEQLRTLGAFANTYGLRRFRVDEQLNRISFEYDASRLKESQVANVLRMAKIPIERKV